MLTHKDVTDKLSNLGVADRFIAKAGDSGLSAMTILRCLRETMFMVRGAGAGETRRMHVVPFRCPTTKLLPIP